MGKKKIISYVLILIICSMIFLFVGYKAGKVKGETYYGIVDIRESGTNNLIGSAEGSVNIKQTEDNPEYYIISVSTDSLTTVFGYYKDGQGVGLESVDSEDTY